LRGASERECDKIWTVPPLSIARFGALPFGQRVAEARHPPSVHDRDANGGKWWERVGKGGKVGVEPDR
jgi:hypothetical protein